MIDEVYSTEYIIGKSNNNTVQYPFSEKIIFDNDSVAIVTHKNDNVIRIGLVCKITDIVQCI